MLSKVLLTGLAFLAFGLAKFVYNLLVYRGFSPTFLGEINQVLSVFLLVPLFYAPGLGTVVSKFAAEFLGSKEPHKAKQVFCLSFVLVAVASVVCTIITLAIFPYLKGRMEVERGTVAALAPMLVLYGLYTFLRSSYYGFDRVPLYLRNEVVSSAIFFVVLAAAVVARSRLLVVLPFVAHSATFAAIAIHDLRDQFSFRTMLSGIAPQLRRYGHFFFCTVVNSLAGPGAFYLGIILTGRVTGDKALVGQYSLVLYSLQALNLLPMSLLNVMMPTISHHYGAGRTREGVEVAERAFRPLFLLMTLIWGGGMILGWEAVQAVSGGATTQLTLVFEVMLFAAYFLLISTAPGVLLNATEYIGVIAWGAAVSFVMAIAVWWGALPAYGLLGSAAGYAVLQVTKGVWSFVAARRIFQWRARVGWTTVLTIPVIVALGMVSLRSESRWFHTAIAILFVGLFLVFHARTIQSYMAQLIAEVRSFAPGLVRPSDGEGC